MFDIAPIDNKKNKKSPKNSKQIKRRKPTKNQNIITIIVAVASIILLLIYFRYKNSTIDYKNLKLDEDKYLVYTKYNDTSSKYTKEIPFINMKSEVIKEVNKDIKIFSNNFIDLENSALSYEYDINGIILSVVLKAVNNETEYAPEVYFRTYNINLETQEVLADVALLNYFDITEDVVEEKIKNRFEELYANIVDEGYFEIEECNYKCFMKWRNVESYLEDVNYYVKDGKLIVFKPFIFYSIFGEENYFKDSDFEFEIATAPATN